MLNIHVLTLGLFQTNCYIVHSDGCDRCVVIDPGYDHKRILTFLTDKGLHLEAILLTHGHFDHVGAVEKLANATSCAVFLHSEELQLPAQITAGPLYYTDFYAEQVRVADMDISVLHTPGHTPGSVCLLMEDAMFSGDTLFAGSCGRTDLPGGSWETIQESLRYLCELSKDYTVYPGHGESTTLNAEKLCNPYFKL